MSADNRVATNQSPPLVGHDVVRSDLALVDAVTRHAAGSVVDDLAEIGRAAGTEEAREQGQQANRNEPELTPYDRYGNRVDEVRFHPSWHWLMERGIGFGLAATPWTSDDPHAHVRRSAGFFAWSQTEPGHGCPISMTYAAVPALRADDAVAKEWTPRLASTTYDFGIRPVEQKAGALAGMGMTEKQGGSDVRQNLTEAHPTQVDGEYTLHGHKWFTSAPMNDVFLVLAQAPGGLSCFLVPRVLPDGTRNQLDIVRLKDKLGNRSNASSELEFRGTWAQRLGDEGRGVRTIIEMVAATRLDCVLGSASLMRKALAEASWHVAHRSAFGSLLADKPLMQNVVADLAVESEAASTLGIRLAAAVDRRADAHEAAFRRIALPLAKYWVCKRTPMMVAEALECLGGNGYVEESGMPLLFRESPLNSIWEGSGNVNALDVLRALSREPEVLDAWITEVGRARGGDPRLDQAITSTLETLADSAGNEGYARRLASQMAACLQGALLVQHAPAEVADAFCSSRLGQEYAGTLGTLDLPRLVVARDRGAGHAGRRVTLADATGERFVGEDWYGEDLAARVFVDCELRDVDLTEATSRGASFQGCLFAECRLNASRHETSSFTGCEFRRTSFFDATFEGCRMTGSLFVGCRMRPVTVRGGQWRGVTMRGANLTGLTLTDLNLTEADLTEADLSDADLSGCDLSGALLRGTRLHRTDLRRAHLERADLAGALLRETKLDVAGAVLLAEAHGAVVGA